MFSTRSSVHYSSWFAQGEEHRQTLGDFTQALLPCILPLSEIHSSLQEAYQPFQYEQEILPYQRRRATRALTALCTHLETCTYFLKDTASLPLVLLALRYRLLDEFYSIEEQARKLMDLINRYNRSSSASSQQNQMIDTLFTTILQNVIDTPENVTLLMTEAKFQEKRLR